MKNGNVVSQQRFLPFGGTRTWEGANSTPWQNRGYTGHLHHDEVGLIYMNARYYVPSLGRFASADTIVPDPANPQQFNRFSYVLNNPIRLTDPSGHMCESNNSGLPINDICLYEDGSKYIPPKLPSHKPQGLNEYGQAAWQGLQGIQQMAGGWWGSELDAQEAIMLVLNHELGTELSPNGHSAPMDVLINQYNTYCADSVWSTQCLNKFWGYSHVIRGSIVALDGGDRFKNSHHKQWVRQTATALFNHALQPVNPYLFHYGNAFDESARRLLQDYDNGVMTYATYVSVSGRELDPVTQSLTVSSVFAVQTDAQWQKTKTLQWWIYPEE